MVRTRSRPFHPGSRRTVVGAVGRGGGCARVFTTPLLHSGSQTGRDRALLLSGPATGTFLFSFSATLYRFRMHSLAVRQSDTHTAIPSQHHTQSPQYDRPHLLCATYTSSLPGRQGLPLSTGASGGGLLPGTLSPTPGHLPPRSQEVAMESVSKYRLWWPPGACRPPQMASRLSVPHDFERLSGGPGRLVPVWSCQ